MLQPDGQLTKPGGLGHAEGGAHVTSQAHALEQLTDPVQLFTPVQSMSQRVEQEVGNWHESAPEQRTAQVGAWLQATAPHAFTPLHVTEQSPDPHSTPKKQLSSPPHSTSHRVAPAQSTDARHILSATQVTRHGIPVGQTMVVIAGSPSIRQVPSAQPRVHTVGQLGSASTAPPSLFMAASLAGPPSSPGAPSSRASYPYRPHPAHAIANTSRTMPRMRPWYRAERAWHHPRTWPLRAPCPRSDRARFGHRGYTNAHRSLVRRGAGGLVAPRVVGLIAAVRAFGMRSPLLTGTS